MTIPRRIKETPMYKLFAYWSAPKAEDVEAFEEYYLSTHVPKASAVPHLERIVTTRTSDGFEGGETPHYRVAEMVFASRAAMDKSAESPEWTTMRECSGAIIERFGVDLTVEMGEEVTDTPGAG
jgi:uncharacterized protein (TIGR02118 family)